MLGDLTHARDWLKSLDIDLAKSRFARYEHYIRDLERTTLVFRFLSHEAYDALVEASDIVLIHRGLSKVTPSAAVDI